MGKEPDFRFKLVLIGPWGVGKTSLVRKYVEQAFSENYLPTIGANVMGKEIMHTIGGKDYFINLTIWDIAAQESFKNMRPGFYGGANGIFLVADLSRKESFTELFDWNGELKKYMPNAPKILLANKCDLPAAIGDGFLDEICLKIKPLHTYKTSALNGDNVLAAFLSLTEKMVQDTIKKRNTILLKQEADWRASIQYLYVLVNSGILIYERDLREQPGPGTKRGDSNLFGGALVAISALLKEVAENSAPLKVVRQEGFTILVEEGNSVLLALITTAESKLTRQKMLEFIKEFESTYSKPLSKLTETGNIESFKSAKKIVQKIFH